MFSYASTYFLELKTLALMALLCGHASLIVTLDSAINVYYYTTCTCGVVLQH